jgi:glyoxylase-like metal-dependent hydrolase (beta-lactamase superfamily II)
MTITTYPIGPFAVNSYCVTHSTDALVIDPGSHPEEIIYYIQTKQLDLQGILITHPHIDHVEGVNSFIKAFPSTKTFMSSDGSLLLSDISAQARMFGLPDPGKIIITNEIKSELSFSLGSIEIQPIQTPGHCIGSLSYLIDDAIFTGDALFKGTIGRTDLPGGDHGVLISSIKNKLFVLDEKLRVYPGHGDMTTIGDEKRMNPFLR